MAKQLPTRAPGKTGSNENIVSPVDTSWMSSVFDADWFKGLKHDVQKNFRNFLVEWAKRSAKTQTQEREAVIDAQKAKTEAVRATTDTMKNSFIRDSVLKDRQRRGYRTVQQRINEATDPETRKYYQDIQNEKLESLGYRNEGGYGSYALWKKNNPGVSLKEWRDTHYKPLYFDTRKEAQQAWSKKSIDTGKKDSKGNPILISRDDAMKRGVDDLKKRVLEVEGGSPDVQYHGQGVVTFGEKAHELARKKGAYADDKGGRVMRERGWLDSFFNRTRVQAAAKAGKSRQELSRLLNRRHSNG